MQQLLITWAILRLIWEAKGYSMKEMPGILLARWTGRKGLAFSSLQRKAKNAQGAPEDVTDFITDEKTLPTREGHETTAKLLRLGMAALFGNAAADPGPTQGRLSTTQTRPTMRGWLSRKLDALASSAFSLLAKLTSAEAKLKAALALITSKLDALASAVTSKLDALASAITSKLDGLASSLGSLLTMLTGARRTLDAVNGKLDNVLGTLGQVAATVNHIDAKGDLAEYARERESRRVMRAVGLVGLLGLVGFAAVLVLLVGVLFAVRQNQSPP
ncbi:MAG TPA: hypothetical protein VK447_17390, partial [Myxococcaceae bacterium]|nr:hypothetical protein [Myxococcaceae bacterium]